LDIEEGTGNLLQTRPAIGGNIMATIKTPDHRPQMATVRPKSSRMLPKDTSRLGKIITVPVTDDMLDNRVEILGYRKDATDFVNVEEADIIIAGGKGLKKAENLNMIRKLADAFGGVVGASREAVDRGWIGYPHQIGLSGKTVSPKLYIGIGISGAIQHLAGIKTSEIIVSINSDPEASLHKVADFAIVGDLFQVIPEIQRRMDLRKGESK
jgi:electron transfer flavoprotein alpha subunit